MKFAIGIFLPALTLVSCVQEPEGIHYVPDPPTVIHTTPAHLETGVSPSTTVTTTFSEMMDASTLNGSTFILLRAGPFGLDTINGAVTYSESDSTATFTPLTALLPGQTYLAKLLQGIIDTECDTLADTSWMFTIAPVAPVCPSIIVTSTTPVDGAVNVDRNAVITATFSTPIDPSSINATTFTVMGSGFPVFGTISYSNGDSTVTFTPDNNLLPGHPYTVTLTSQIVDSANGCPLTPHSWTFITTNAPTPSAPVLDTTDFGDPNFLVVYWLQTAAATTYHLQVSTNPLFTTLVNDQPAIPDPSFFIVSGQVPATAIPAGTYYWRVSASGPGGTSNWSNVKSFLSGYP